MCAQCFPSDATVSVLGSDGTTVSARRMDQLQIGDRVRSQNAFSKVFAFMDNDASASDVEYVRLKTAAGPALQLTADHIVYAHDNMRPVLAEEVKHGDQLWVHASSGELVRGATSNLSTTDSFFASPVTSVRKVARSGMHAPLTEDGSLVVDGVLASSYAKVHSLTWGKDIVLFHGHDINMQMHAPLRLACSAVPSLCGEDMHSETGRHAWTEFLLSKFSWLSAMNSEYHDLRAALTESPTIISVFSAVVQLAAAVLLRLLFGAPDYAIAAVAGIYGAMLAYRGGKKLSMVI